MSQGSTTRSRRAGAAPAAPKGMAAPSAGTAGPPDAAAPGWVRPVAARTRPDRHFGGYYRSADPQVGGQALRGVPLTQAEDAAVAAVRMAYGIADAQIERGMRVARQLRGAAARQGSSPADALGATERLVEKAMLAVLEWMEGAATSPEHPVRRLAGAELRLLARLLGLAADAGGPLGGAAGPAPAAAAAASESQSARGAPPGPQASGGSTGHGQDMGGAGASTLRLINTAPTRSRRPVRVVGFDHEAGREPWQLEAVYFHRHEASADEPPLAARWAWDGTAATLTLEVGAATPRGRWVAGLYDAQDVQRGVIELQL